MPANRRVPRVVGCDGFNSVQLSRQTTDLGKIAAFYEAVAVLDRHDPLSPGEALHPLVTVQDHLRTKRWIAAHPDRYMTPLLIYQMKVEMPDTRPAFSMMDEVYQKLIDRTRAPLDLKQVKTIFGFSHRPHHTAKRGRERTEVFKAVQAASYDLTVFKIKWGNLTLKIYDKGGRVLRIEVVVHNAKELRSGKMLEKLPALLERMRDMLVRFLGTIQAAHVSFLDEGAFEGLSEPTTRGTRRLAGIDLNKARNRHVVDAVVALSTRPNGFTVAQLAEAVRQRSGQDVNIYSARNAAYDVAKLAGKTLVRRIERSRRYAVDPPGVRTLCAYLLLRETQAPIGRRRP